MNFKLQVSPSEVKRLAARYAYDDDTAALAAGLAIRNGDFSRKQLIAIIEWKIEQRWLPGVLREFSKNSDAEVTRALSYVLKTKTEKYAIEQLGYGYSKLQGVGIPLASAIMTMILPEVYTVVDWRVVSELCQVREKEARKLAGDVNFYPAYLSACRQFASESGVSLRDFDRAIWQLSYERTAKCV